MNTQQKLSGRSYARGYSQANKEAAKREALLEEQNRRLAVRIVSLNEENKKLRESPDERKLAIIERITTAHATWAEANARLSLSLNHDL